MPKLLIYVLGLIPVAIGQYWLRGAVGNLIGFVIVIMYLIVLRLAAEKWGTNRKIGANK